MVTDMRPLRVQSADLVDLMRGFAERFRNESGLALDLLIDAAELQIPDRICRDLFQIYRESLHNVKKHAHASHVVVKLWQNDSQVVLVVDDNGEGFSFAGRFTGDELDRLRLGPISIKERTRSVGGVLTVESTPGHGARLTSRFLSADMAKATKVQIRVLMADDHAIFREGLRKLLDSDDEITIVGEASNGNDCIKMLAKLKPDILLARFAHAR
jgi:signal transduction histidine kinase